ncbi:N-acetylmuramoyl-L-alanine amidase [Tamlana sp. 2_MG-2023]|uniref:N-acetylmuramoyl-L-alanine amidase family protein n=1 Tax=unclassified Tamlana TaxID=2614803 RepID=UPI0026E43FA6|nr:MULTISPECIES: N-acetylmuramoyl-L-alanine amidase [unclassified Tamlana]MDO6761864.1 N-acetylmuramoyl-L-alanine amidase [Tamlana sp. 2_MG-2023]MDO6792635.1 N-acetylmuramoyl-L-alanine amidase [Tamlana sp. 1_MG-2023]
MIKYFKSTVKNVGFLLILLNTGILITQEIPLKKIIVIDPGHGGIDSGAVGLYDQEKDIVLSMALELSQWNHQLFENTYELHLTRSSDTLISLSHRMAMAKKLKADAFISIHCNAGASSAKGIEVFVPEIQGVYAVETSKMAAAILREFQYKLSFNSRGIKMANFRLLKQSIHDYPAILLELGFITNKDEGLYFSRKQHIKAMALAILLGLINYLNY